MTNVAAKYCTVKTMFGNRIPLVARFSAPVQTDPVTHPQWVPGLFPGDKEAGAWH